MSNVFESIYKVSEPSSQKSGLRKIFEKVTGSPETMTQVKNHAIATVQAIRGVSEAGGIGFALGAIHAADPQGNGTGLDLVVRKATGAGGTDGKTVDAKTGQLMAPKPAMTIPADAALAGAATVMSLVTASHGGPDGISTDFRNLGMGAAATFGFRKGVDVVAAKKRKEGKAVGGTAPSLVSLQREANMKALAHGESFGADGDLVAQTEKLLAVG